MNTIACPNCDRRLHNPGEAVMVKCPICATVFQVPIRAALLEEAEPAPRARTVEPPPERQRDEPLPRRRDRDARDEWDDAKPPSGGLGVLWTLFILFFVIGLLFAAAILIVAIVNARARPNPQPGPIWVPPVDPARERQEEFWYNWVVGWGDGPGAPTPEEWAFVQNPLHPTTHPSVHYVRGALHVRARQYAEAQRAFDQGQREAPHSRLAVYLAQYRALAAYFSGQDPTVLHRTLNNPLNGHQLFDLLLPHVEQDGDEALERYLDYYDRVSPQHPPARQSRLFLRARQGRWDEVWALCRSMDEPFLERDWYRLYSLIVQNGMTTEAYRNLPDSQRFIRLAGQLRSDRKQQAALRALLASHRAKVPNDPQLLRVEGWLLAQENKYAEAAERFLRAQNGCAPDDLPQIQNEYFRARLLAGKGLLTWVRQGRKDEQLWPLRQQMVREKDIGQLTLLSHLFHSAGNHVQGRLVAAQLRTIQNDWEGAFTVLETGKERGDLSDNDLLTVAHLFAERPEWLLRLYRLCADRKLAFSRLGYVGSVGAQQALMHEHGRAHPTDPVLLTRWANLYIQRKDYAAAAAYLKKARAHTEASKQSGLLFLEQQLAIPLDRAEAYLDLPGASPENLLRQCLREKRNDLFLRIVAHCDDKGHEFPFWVGMAEHWIEGRPDELIAACRNRSRMLREDSRLHHELLEWYVLSFVQLGRKEEALAEAERLKTYTWNGWRLKLRVLAGLNDLPGFLDEAKKHPNISQLYFDEFFGPLVRSPALAEFRKRFPEPKAEPPEDRDPDFFDFDDD